MRQPLVAGNWKMHGSRAENAALVRSLLDLQKAESRTEVMVCPPFVYLWELGRLLKDTDVALGAQSVCAESQGAFTGEVSASMLKDVGCRYVLVGHSERRQIYGEDDALVARKFVAAQSHGLVPVLCVGETLEEREGDRTAQVVARQLDAVLSVAGVAALDRAVIAYEPVWAIGTGRTASPEQAQEVHGMIRGKVAALDGTIAASVRVLYGGSVKASNARELLAMPDIDGGLVGGASLKADEFARICAAAD
ncbi:MAG TPA: triose-phosphate isomerase [Steroidobacteraceae bacterium]|nr:triose-phosphate isomerase [Steroidobacteraceae bacterium]